LQCQKLSGGCPGANGNNCQPYQVWSGILAPSGNHYQFYLGNGVFKGPYSDHPITDAFTVRCVLDLKSNADNCYPYYIWSGTESDGKYHDYYLNQGAFKTLLETGTYAYGVRCVLDLEFFEAKDVLGMRTVKKIT